ncbi:unnamed protein product [Amoebophrya sp. A25]|nr:unnamed protein product [Amoebophrya sp. A25]|eukprot:GSA25T00019297001.1
MLLFPSFFRWPESVSALRPRRGERRGGLLWRVGQSAFRLGDTVSLLSSAFSLTPLQIGLYHAAARQVERRDDQGSRTELRPVFCNPRSEREELLLEEHTKEILDERTRVAKYCEDALLVPTLACPAKMREDEAGIEAIYGKQTKEIRMSKWSLAMPSRTILKLKRHGSLKFRRCRSL